MIEDADAVEIKLKRQNSLLNQSQTEIIVLRNSKMTELREKNKLCQRKWNRLNKQKKGLEHINHQKVLKIAGLFNEIERINPKKEITDIEATEQKSTSIAVLRRLKRNLET